MFTESTFFFFAAEALISVGGPGTAFILAYYVLETSGIIGSLGDNTSSTFSSSVTLYALL